MSNNPITRDAIRRARIIFTLLAALYFLAALVDPCDGHSCSQDGHDSVSALSAD